MYDVSKHHEPSVYGEWTFDSLCWDNEQSLHCEFSSGGDVCVGYHWQWHIKCDDGFVGECDSGICRWVHDHGNVHNDSFWRQLHECMQHLSEYYKSFLHG